jgi:hypothetical protein
VVVTEVAAEATGAIITPTMTKVKRQITTAVEDMVEADIDMVVEEEESSAIIIINLNIMHRTAEAKPAEQVRQSNFVEASTQNDKTSFLAQNEVEEHNDIWFLDSGVINHMCSKNELFSNVEEIKWNVSLTDSIKLDVQGKITIKNL